MSIIVRTLKQKNEIDTKSNIKDNAILVSTSEIDTKSND